MTAKILIYVPCFNRRRILQQCVPTIVDGMAEGDLLSLWNDGSTEYDDDWLRLLRGNMEVRHPITEAGRLVTENIGIERQRRAHFENFYYREEDYTHMYLTDSDALCDPRWRERALHLQNMCDGAPVCLYNTQAHERLVGNTIKHDPTIDVIWRRRAPGISYLLTAEQAVTVFHAIQHLPDPLHWDWSVPVILGERMAISRTSYVDHIGDGGIHDPGEGLDGGDRALTPTKKLSEMRKEIVAKLSSS